MATETSIACWNCRLRPATVDWVGSGGALAWVHGGGQRWCLRCVLTKQIEHAEQCAASLPELRAKLAAEEVRDGD